MTAKKRWAAVSFVSAPCLQGGSHPSWERKRLLLEEHTSLPGSPPHQHPQNWQTLTDSTSWGSRTLIFPVLSFSLSFFFFSSSFFFFFNNQICRKLAGAGRHWAGGGPLKNPPNSRRGFGSRLLRWGMRSGFVEISQLTQELFGQTAGEEVKMGPPVL